MSIQSCFIAIPRPTETPIEVTIDPNALTIMPGENHTLTCRVNTSAVLGWSFNGGLLPNNVVTKGKRGRKSTLEIFSASELNGGVYTCFTHSPSGAFDGFSFTEVTYFGMKLIMSYKLLPCIINYLYY